LLLHDKFGRAITDLRISITDRCNYKCVYCRTGNEGALYGDLPFEDYLRMTRVLEGMGIRKIRLTGGEPLLRKGVVEFVRELAKLQPHGLKPSSSLSANGTAKAVPFHEASGPHLPTVPTARRRRCPFKNSRNVVSTIPSPSTLRSPPTGTCWLRW